MTSKLRKAIGAVKDQTSISIAKVSSNNAANLEVAILKATTHEETPIEEKYVSCILQLVASDKVYAAACAHVISKRIGKTRTWTVALKCLILVLRIFQDGDPYFPKEVLHAMKRGAKILNLSSFRDDSNSPWDYTAFVRTFALYLDERLDCFITGKFQKRYTNRESYRNRNSRSPVCDMKPAMLLDRMSYWQRLLDRATVTRPTGIAKTNKLVQICVHAVVQETFDLYRDISDGLALLLDSFFQLPYQSCVLAFQCCLKANKQFDELSTFYDMCRSIGIGRTSEYPSVQKISEELLETLRDFLKDQASMPANGSSSPVLPPMPPGLKPSRSGYSSVSYESNEENEPYEKFSEKGSEYGSACTSLEDLMNCAEFGTSPSRFVNSDQDGFCDQLDKQSQHGQINFSIASSTAFSFPSPSNQPRYSAPNLASFDDRRGSKQEKYPKTQPTYKAPEFVSFDAWPQNENKGGNDIGQEQKQISTASNQLTSYKEWPDQAVNKKEQKPKQLRKGWDQELISNTSHSNSKDVWELALPDTFLPFTESSMFVNPHVLQVYNPFLDMETELNATIPTTSAIHKPTYSAPADQAKFPSRDMIWATPTFQAAPTFSAQSLSAETVALQHDPFETTVSGEHNKPSGIVDQQRLLSEQQLWLQNQNKIIGKHVS